MGSDFRTAVFMQTNDAEFRVWVTAVHDALSAAGMIQTSDTGQINLTTVAAPTLTNTAQGYEIWRMDDTHQGAAPVYIKIEYGSLGNANRPNMWATVGTGSDGAGNINGTTVLARTAIGGTATGTPTSNPVKIWVSHHEGSFTLSINNLNDSGANLMAPLLHVSRWADRSGPLATGWFVFYGSNSTTGTSVPFRVSDATLITGAQGGNYVACPPIGIGSTSYLAGGAYLPMFYAYTWGPDMQWLPGIVGHALADFAPGSTVAVVGIDGVSRNYLILGSYNSLTGIAGGSSGDRIAVEV